MRSITFYIVFSIIILIYAAINYYIYRRAIQAIPQNWNIKTIFTIAFIVIAASYLLGRWMEKVWLSTASDIFVWVGSFWLAAMVYFLFAVLLLDLLRLVNHWLPFLPDFIKSNYGSAKAYTLGIVTAGVLITIFSGYINSVNPRIYSMEIDIPKRVNGMDQLKIALVSDIHMGTTFTKKRVQGMVERINSLEPDIILMAGDIVDEDLAPVIRQDLGGYLTKLKAKYGSIAVTGNHEYIGGAEEAIKYLEAHNVKFVRDTSVLIDNKFYIVGREDRAMENFTERKRKPLKELMKDVDLNFPVIMMDHQPFALGKVADALVDIQFSGHTHHGQLFPFNFITNMVYQKSWGYLRIKDSHFYVSSGYGNWGPPIRTGNTTEIVNIILKFTGK